MADHSRRGVSGVLAILATIAALTIVGGPGGGTGDSVETVNGPASTSAVQFVDDNGDPIEFQEPELVDGPAITGALGDPTEGLIREAGTAAEGSAVVDPRQWSKADTSLLDWDLDLNTLFAVSDPEAAANGRLAAVQIYAIARSVGFTPSDAAIMTAIALAESGGNPQAHNGTGEDSWGLWQINLDAHGWWADDLELTDPLVNAEAAFRVARGGKTFVPWSVTHADRGAPYLRYLPVALAAAELFDEADGIDWADKIDEWRDEVANREGPRSTDPRPPAPNDGDSPTDNDTEIQLGDDEGADDGGGEDEDNGGEDAGETGGEDEDEGGEDGDANDGGTDDDGADGGATDDGGTDDGSSDDDGTDEDGGRSPGNIVDFDVDLPTGPPEPPVDDDRPRIVVTDINSEDVDNPGGPDGGNEDSGGGADNASTDGETSDDGAVDDNGGTDNGGSADGTSGDDSTGDDGGNNDGGSTEGDADDSADNDGVGNDDSADDDTGNADDSTDNGNGADDSTDSGDDDGSADDTADDSADDGSADDGTTDGTDCGSDTDGEPAGDDDPADAETGGDPDDCTGDSGGDPCDVADTAGEEPEADTGGSEDCTGDDDGACTTPADGEAAEDRGEATGEDDNTADDCEPEPTTTVWAVWRVNYADGTWLPVCADDSSAQAPCVPRCSDIITESCISMECSGAEGTTCGIPCPPGEPDASGCTPLCRDGVLPCLNADEIEVASAGRGLQPSESELESDEG